MLLHLQLTTVSENCRILSSAMRSAVVVSPRINERLKNILDFLEDWCALQSLYHQREMLLAHQATTVCMCQETNSQFDHGICPYRVDATRPRICSWSVPYPLPSSMVWFPYKTTVNC